MYRPINIIGPEVAARARERSAQTTVNMYLKGPQPGSKGQLALYSCPGLKFHAQAASGASRSNGALFGGSLYVVIGDKLVALNGSGSATEIGTLSTSGGRCDLVGGRNYLLIVDGTTGYTYDGTTFAAIADADFPASPTHCDVLDGFFIVNRDGTDEFYISALDDATSWAALDFETAAADPDDLLALRANYKALYAVGSRTTQVYYNSGNPDFPFQAYPNGVMQIGIQARHTLQSTSVGLFWLATAPEGDVFVVRAAGTEHQVISQDIQWDLTSFSKTDDAFALTYRWAGQTFYQVTFPTEAVTLEYCVEAGTWHKRESFGIGRFRCSGVGYIGNDYLFIDRTNGKVYELDEEVFDEDGATLERKRVSQPFHEGDNKIIFHEVVLDAESGVGLVTGQGSDPQVMMRYSDDGGFTWSNEQWRTLGAIGEYERRVRWRRQGSARQRVFEFSVTDPVDVSFLGAYARVSMARLPGR